MSTPAEPPLETPSVEPVADRTHAGAFGRSDWLAALLVLLVSFALYGYTLMPNVGMLDSGELVTAATLFGVPHPPGYPFWSLTGFILTKLMPIGNFAWRINLLSAIFGALSCALLALLVSASSRWLLIRSMPQDPAQRGRLSFYGGATAGFILAFSEVMWGQAVVSDHVRTQNSFLLLLTFVCMYRWMIDPDKQRWLLASVFVFCLGVTNHPTILANAPAFLLPVYFVRRRFFPSFLVGYVLLAMTAMGVLSWYSNDYGMQAIGGRLALGTAVLSAVIGFWHMREFNLRRFLIGALTVGVVWLVGSLWIGGWFRVETRFGLELFLLSTVAAGFVASSILDWRFIVWTLLAGWCALFMFAKSQISSATNPPMNWSYARENSGLYQSIVRGQYDNSLPTIIKRHVGPLVGYRDREALSTQPKDMAARIEYFGILARTIKLYIMSLEWNFTLPVCLLVFPLFLYFRHLDAHQRPWVYFMIFSFLLLAFTLTFVDTPKQLDNSSWMAVKPFHILSHCLIVMAIGYGVVSGLLYLSERMEKLPMWLLAGSLFIALLPLQENVLKSSRRGHWFGWMYGVDMLKPMDKGAIVFGGTDPGRFIPTYMIFCESQQPNRFKRDPEFDRSDLYIITQNALADVSYERYIRDHYDDRFRPKTYTAFEKWLGRDKQYPKQGLELLDDEAFGQCFREFTEAQARRTGSGYDTLDIFRLNGIVAKWIFEKNKDKHTFYVEESVRIDWMYPYMVPSGLVMRLNKEPLDKLSPAVIAEDRKFWDAYTARLLGDPHFARDVDAQRSFAKLRNSTANMYRWRGLKDEALYAYRQALQLSADNLEVVETYFQYLMQLDLFDEAQELIARSHVIDPRNDSYDKMMADIRQARAVMMQLQEVQQQLRENPKNLNLRMREVELLGNRRNPEEFLSSLEKMVAQPELPNDVFVQYMRLLTDTAYYDDALRLMLLRTKVDPKNGDLHFNLAALAAYRGQTKQSLQSLRQAIALNHAVYTESARTDPRFQSLHKNAEFRKLIPPLAH